MQSYCGLSERNEFDVEIFSEFFIGRTKLVVDEPDAVRTKWLVVNLNRDQFLIWFGNLSKLEKIIIIAFTLRKSILT